MIRDEELWTCANGVTIRTIPSDMGYLADFDLDVTRQCISEPDRILRFGQNGTAIEKDEDGDWHFNPEWNLLARSPMPVPAQVPVELFCSLPDYDQMVSETFEQITQLARVKGAEYAGDHNRLENFVRNAIDNELLPEQVWRIYVGKHWDAIGQYVRDLANGKERKRSEPLEGRVDDVIVYCLLFKAMLRARQSSTKSAL